jgi:hypothetical protein
MASSRAMNSLEMMTAQLEAAPLTKPKRQSASLSARYCFSPLLGNVQFEIARGIPLRTLRILGALCG